MTTGNHETLVYRVRYWIPHIRIISPEGLPGEMEKELRGYLERG
jgi:hypothetical protein